MYLTKRDEGPHRRGAGATGRHGTCASSASPPAGASWVSATSAPTARGIPIGKLQLYTACAAVPPDCLLPILFDIGTTNAALRADPLYTRACASSPRPTRTWTRWSTSSCRRCNEVFPGCCVHFEDWKGTDAIRLLARYQDKYLVYNDDIQGTASVTLAGLTTALQITSEKLTDQRILFARRGLGGHRHRQHDRGSDDRRRAHRRTTRAAASPCSTSTGCSTPPAPTSARAQKVYATRLRRDPEPGRGRRRR